MIKLRRAVGANPVQGRVQVSLGKALRRRPRHFIGCVTGSVQITHPLYNPIQNFLLSGIVLVQGGLGNAKARGDIAHGCAQIPALRKQLQRRFQDSFLRFPGHKHPPSPK